jgi:hypothetical protein
VQAAGPALSKILGCKDSTGTNTLAYFSAVLNRCLLDVIFRRQEYAVFKILFLQKCNFEKKLGSFSKVFCFTLFFGKPQFSFSINWRQKRKLSNLGNEIFEI